MQVSIIDAQSRAHLITFCIKQYWSRKTLIRQFGTIFTSRHSSYQQPWSSWWFLSLFSTLTKVVSWKHPYSLCKSTLDFIWGWAESAPSGWKRVNYSSKYLGEGGISISLRFRHHKSGFLGIQGQLGNSGFGQCTLRSLIQREVLIKW